VNRRELKRTFSRNALRRPRAGAVRNRGDRGR